MWNYPEQWACRTVDKQTRTEQNSKIALIQSEHDLSAKGVIR